MTLKEKIANLPLDSGVYIHKDKDGNIIYIGKAKCLKNRVKHYFMPNISDAKTRELVKNIVDFDYIVTPNELDALLLENNLIKKHTPFYNILLKDAKTYPYIKADTTSEFPSLEITRKVKNDGCKYFGPFLSISPKDIIEIITYAYPIKTCSYAFTSKKPLKRECINYEMGLCSAPCTNKISHSDYKKVFEKVINFLSGQTDNVKEILTKKMMDFANNEQFELAIKIKQLLLNLNKICHNYTTQSTKIITFDAIGYHIEEDYACVCVLPVRDGKMLDANCHIIKVGIEGAEDSILHLLIDYYNSNYVCKNFVLNYDFSEKEIFEKFLQSKREDKVNFSYPKKQQLFRVLEMANKNACKYFEREIDKEKVDYQRTIGATIILQKELNLPKAPYRIEGYDISNISGVDKVASMVVCIDGKMTHKLYRKFKIKTVEGANDFASLNETLNRRLARITDKDESFSQVPDLIMIDGGKGQLSAVYEDIKKINPNISVISLAKKEEIIFTSDGTPHILDKRNLGLQLLQRIRDEAHRFAITFFKQIHSKKVIESKLNEIKGIGKSKRKLLVENFGSMKKLENATMQQLSLIKGLSKQNCLDIIDYFKENKSV